MLVISKFGEAARSCLPTPYTREFMDTTRFGCNGNTIKVAQGHYVNLIDPDPDTLDLVSVASALSKMCRYGGHTPQFYSVAEHSVLCVALAREDGFDDPDFLRSILMHDAAEAYTGDCVKPLKVILPDFQVVERAMEAAVAERFGVDFTFHHQGIKRYDNLMLVAESKLFWPNDSDWEGFSNVPVRTPNIQCLTPQRAELAFLTEALTLGIK